jgi:YEATS domain-containing protein 4
MEDEAYEVVSQSNPPVTGASQQTASGSTHHPTAPPSKRQRGMVLYRPIVYGNTATLLKKPEQENTHSWTVYFRGLNNEDISYYVSKVEFILHESFPNPTRIIEKWPFEISEYGWGEFEIQIKVHFIDPLEKILTLQHFLRLYPLEDDQTVAITTNLVPHPNPNKATIVMEHYDEIVFQDPTFVMVAALTDPVSEATSLHIPKFPPKSPYEVAEKMDLSRLSRARSLVNTEIQKHQVRQSHLLKDIQRFDRSSASDAL